MVRSRSTTNLNRILLDLCTSPDIRRKHVSPQRHYHPPLPTLKPMRSNSCPNIDEIAQTMTTSSSSNSDQDRSCSRATAIPLVPIESLGFTVQGSTLAPNPSLKLFGTTSISHSKQSSAEHKLPDKKKDFLSAPLDSQLASEDLQNPDFINRLQNRLKSRGHLRKFFLS